MMSWSSLNNVAVVINNSVFILNRESGSIKKLYEAYDCESISSLCFNPEGNKLAVGNCLGEMTIWDIQKEQDIHSYEIH